MAKTLEEAFASHLKAQIDAFGETVIDMAVLAELHMSGGLYSSARFHDCLDKIKTLHKVNWTDLETGEVRFSR